MQEGPHNIRTHTNEVLTKRTIMIKIIFVFAQNDLLRLFQFVFFVCYFIDCCRHCSYIYFFPVNRIAYTYSSSVLFLLFPFSFIS